MNDQKQTDELIAKKVEPHLEAIDPKELEKMLGEEVSETVTQPEEQLF